MFSSAIHLQATKRTATFFVILFSIFLSGCDSLAPQQNGQDLSNEELEARVQEELGGQVTALQVRTIDVGQVTEELQAGETTIPIVNPENEVVEVTLQSRPANLRPDSVDTGLLRQGPETVERVPLPPEQSYLLGEPENASRYGGITVLDEDHTMLRGLVRHSDFGLSYIQSVNHILQTDAYPNRHVIYNAKNTESFNIADGEYLPSKGSAKSQQKKGARAKRFKSTSVVLDGDVDFYNINPNTVWRRQESLLLFAQLMMGFEDNIASGPGGLLLRIAGQEVWVQGGPSTTNPNQLMNRLEDPNYFLLNSLSEKQMHLFLVGYDVNGLAGLAGGIGSKSGGWGGGNDDNHLLSETLSRRSLHINRLILAHEIGHLIGGLHRKAITSGCSESECGRSLMNHVITPSTEDFFSDANDRRISSVVNATVP